jgi:hypothetical protein
MKLNLEILCERLEKNYQIRLVKNRRKALTLCRPVFYEVGVAMEKETFYIVKDDMLPDVPPPTTVAAICIGKELPPSWVRCKCSLLILSSSHTVASVFNAVQRIFDEFDEWERKLVDELRSKEFDFQCFLRLGMEMIHNPIFISDVFLQYRVSSKLTITDSGMETEICLRPTYMDTEYIGEMKDYCILERKLREPFLSGMLVSTPQNPKCRVYCYNVYLHDRFIAIIIIPEFSRPFHAADFPIADFFFPLLQQAYEQFLLSDVEAEPHNKIFLKLVNNENLSAEEYERIMLTSEQNWLCFKLVVDNTGRSLQADYACAVIRSQLLESSFVSLDDSTITGILKVNKAAEKHDEAISILEWVCERMGYYGGFSNYFSDIKQLEQYALQAEFSVKQCQKCATKTVLFQDCILEYILDEIDREQPLNALTSKGLSILLEHDEKKGSEYLKTLEVWLNNETNVSKAATELYIHRSSMQNRLEKIEELTGDDFLNPHVRLYYRIYLAVLNRADL